MGVALGRLALLGLVASGCTSARLLRVENDMLQRSNDALQRELEVARVKGRIHPVDLGAVAGALGAAGRSFTAREDAVELACPADSGGLRLELRWFAESQIVYLGTRDYLTLSDARDADATWLLLVQVATLNFEALVGKFQLDPESGEIVVSVELHAGEGLGSATLLGAVDRLCATAWHHRAQLVTALDVGPL